MSPTVNDEGLRLNKMGFAIVRLSNKQQGASMVEVLVAILVFSIGVLGYAAIQTRGLKESFDNGQRTTAVWQVQELIDRIQVNAGQVDYYVNNISGFSLATDCGTPAQYCATTPSSAAQSCSPGQLASFDIWDTLCNMPAEIVDGTVVREELIDVVFQLDCAAGAGSCATNTDLILTYIWISKAAQDDERIAAIGADSTDTVLDENEQRYQVRFRP